MAGDLILFFILALLSITASVLVMESRDIFHAALFLALVFVSIAGLFILLTAEFLAAIQVLIYAGAVIVLILFAIVLTKRGPDIEETSIKNLVQRTFLIMILVVLLILPLIRTNWPADIIEFSGLNTYNVGFSLFTDYVIPFEIVSLALLSALIGAVYISRREVGDQ